MTLTRTSQQCTDVVFKATRSVFQYGPGLCIARTQIYLAPTVPVFCRKSSPHKVLFSIVPSATQSAHISHSQAQYVCVLKRVFSVLSALGHLGTHMDESTRLESLPAVDL